MRKTFLSTFFIIALFSLSTSAKQEQSFNRSLSLDTGNNKNVFIDVGSGSLNVRGENVENISISAKIHSKEYRDLEDLQEAFEDKMIFTLEDKGSTIVFKALNKKRWFSMKSPNISIDVDIVIPRHMNLEIDDGSGSMKVINIDGNLTIDDGSGSTFINNIGGDLLFDDGSGSMEISNIRGDVDIDDGSGKAILTNITGNVYIDDGSGTVDIVNVGGDVTIDDGSGSINIEQLAGNFKLIDGGSGSVYVNGNKWISD